MNYKEMRKIIDQMATESYKDFIKALISFEKGVNDEEMLDKIYEFYMENDSVGLISDEINDIIDLKNTDIL